MPKKKTKRKQRTSVGGAEEITEAAGEGKLLIGSNRVFRCMRKGEIKTVIFASNLPEAKRKDVERYGSISKTEVREFSGDSAKLGESCGKPFSVLIIGIRK